MAQSEQAREALLELLGVAAGGQPEVERRVDQVDDLALVEDASGEVDLCFARPELARRERLVVVLADQIENLPA